MEIQCDYQLKFEMDIKIVGKTFEKTMWTGQVSLVCLRCRLLFVIGVCPLSPDVCATWHYRTEWE